MEVKKAFVRGLFDTDGCVRFEKNRTAFHYYPRIEFGFASKSLRDGLLTLLNELGFKTHIWQNINHERAEYRVGLAGFTNLDKWLKEINSSNSKHLNRIKEGLLNKDKVKLKVRGGNV